MAEEASEMDSRNDANVVATDTSTKSVEAGGRNAKKR